MIDAALRAVPEAERMPTAVVISPGPGDDGSDAEGALSTLSPESVAVISADHSSWQSSAGTLVTFGLSPAADVRADDVDVSIDGTTFSLRARGEVRRVSLRVLGEHLATSALAAIAVALAHGVTLDNAVEALESLRGAGPGRMERIDRSDGVTIIDDAAGSEPQSTAAALKALAQVGIARRTVAVLGELTVDGDGDDHAAAHDRIGRLIVRLNVKKLVVVGHDARHIHNAAGLEGSWDGESVLVDTVDEAYDLLREELQPEDVVLVKASKHAGFSTLAHRLGEAIP